jgi:FkbM family methyltransferase
MKTFIQKLLELNGLKIIRYPEKDLKRRLQLIDSFKINKIFDVGANVGQYSLQMRNLGFKGEIISFEPLKQAFSKLQRAASKDSKWMTQNIALGDQDTETTINVAGNSYSSSILDMLPAHFDSAPQSSYVSKEKIIVKKLDTIIDGYYKEGDRVLLKIDTQGFERNVIEGAKQSLHKICGIQVEMSIVQLYNGEMIFTEMIQSLKEKGFEIFSLENGFSDEKTGKLLQVDGIFFNNSLIS